jgi:WD40 repeat protein
MTNHSTSDLDLICASVAISSDGQILIGHFRDRGQIGWTPSRLLKIWSTVTGELIDTIYVPDSIKWLVPLPNAQTLIATKTNGSVAFLDFKTGQTLGSLQAPPFKFTSDLLSQNREIVAGIQSGEITVWDLKANRVINSFHLQNVTCAALSPDGTTLVAGNENDEGGIIKVWDVHNGQEIHSLVASTYSPRPYNPWLEGSGDESRGVTGVSISPDNQTVLCLPRSGDVQIWDLKTEQKRLISGSIAQGIGDFSIDGEWVINMFGQVFNHKTCLKDQHVRAHSFIVRSIPVSQDGHIIAIQRIQGGFRRIELQRVATREIIGVFAKQRV